MTSARESMRVGGLHRLVLAGLLASAAAWGVGLELVSVMFSVVEIAHLDTRDGKVSL